MKISSKEIIERIALMGIMQAEKLVTGSRDGALKLEYATNVALNEFQNLPLPIYIRIAFVIFRFVFKSEIRQEVQDVFNKVKDIMNSPEATANE